MFFCAEIQPSWIQSENVASIEFSHLKTSDFIADFEQKSRPVIIRGGCAEWPAIGKWSKEYLVDKFGEVPFTCGPCDLQLREFFSYSDNSQDDVRLFVFDRKFPQRAPALLDDYQVPQVFRNRDLFDLLGGDRPHFRWVLMGGKKTGSKWHIDPNKTCAWNAVVSGRKRWLMLPPGCPPPGVHPSADGSDVIQPVNLLEWFSNFYAELKTIVSRNPSWDLQEVTCGPGDVVFIPCGWWHCVLNLEETFAVTQNYCSETHVQSVRRFLREKPHAVSGTPEPELLSQRFEKVLSAHRPDLLVVQQETPKKDEPGSKFSFWDHVRSTGKQVFYNTSSHPEGAARKRPNLQSSGP